MYTHHLHVVTVIMIHSIHVGSTYRSVVLHINPEINIFRGSEAYYYIVAIVCVCVCVCVCACMCVCCEV